MPEAIKYESEDGHCPFDEWLENGLTRQDIKAAKQCWIDYQAQKEKEAKKGKE